MGKGKKPSTVRLHTNDGRRRVERIATRAVTLPAITGELVRLESVQSYLVTIRPGCAGELDRYLRSRPTISCELLSYDNAGIVCRIWGRSKGMDKLLAESFVRASQLETTRVVDEHRRTIGERTVYGPDGSVVRHVSSAVREDATRTLPARDRDAIIRQNVGTTGGRVDPADRRERAELKESLASARRSERAIVGRAIASTARVDDSARYADWLESRATMGYGRHIARPVVIDDTERYGRYMMERVGMMYGR